MMRIAFVVPGEPVPKGRARVGVGKRADGSAFPRVFTPATTTAYESKVRTLAQVAVNQARGTWAPGKHQRFAMTLRVFRTHEGKGGDLDNYVKAILDALNGVVWPDDRYVRAIESSVAQDAERPRVEVYVETRDAVTAKATKQEART